MKYPVYPTASYSLAASAWSGDDVLEGSHLHLDAAVRRFVAEVEHLDVLVVEGRAARSWKGVQSAHVDFLKFLL